MEQIMREKVNFIEDNKDLIIDNLGIIKFDLFNILIKEENLNDMIEYNNICRYFEKKTCVLTDKTRDVLYIIYALSNFLDKICIKEMEKQNYKTILDNYINYVILEKEKEEKTKLNQMMLY